MKITFRVPTVAVICVKCGHHSQPGGVMRGDRAEVEVPCHCPIPELSIGFFYPESATPVGTMPLEISEDRRLREGNASFAGARG